AKYAENLINEIESITMGPDVATRTCYGKTILAGRCAAQNPDRAHILVLPRRRHTHNGRRAHGHCGEIPDNVRSAVTAGNQTNIDQVWHSDCRPSNEGPAITRPELRPEGV